MQKQYPSLKDALQKVIGRAITLVNFVEDYVQISWDTSILTAYTMPTLLVGSTAYSQDHTEYQYEMFRLEGQRLKEAQVNGEEDITLVFESGTCLSISLRDSDYVAPEALLYQELGGLLWVA